VFAYNVGYHNEHHDFPSVPWTRLPALKALAPEFYDVLPAHPSWPMVIVNFVLDGDAGLFARAKRLAAEAEGKRAAWAVQIEFVGCMLDVRWSSQDTSV
jgi:sphingolipid delta-4 desaturase